MVDLSKRSGQKELMDDFGGTPEAFQEVLVDISRVNRVLGGNRITLNAVFKLITENPKKSYTILDVGCGEGTMLRTLARAAKKRTIGLKLIGVDLNTDALKIGRENSTDFPEIEYREQDVLQGDIKNLKCDIIITTLTMHHFSDMEIKRFIKRFSNITSLGIIVNDLHRSRLAYYLYKLFSLFFIKTRTAKIDGLISIRRGFLKSDLKSLASSITGVQHEIHWKWAFRYVWTIRTNALKESYE
ncbi:methyltransferase domain-containing protein [Maribacter sp. 2304DJ31-5]|uniref:methyltransferase domain-containing protein n=1 Tax=Maribacter sp. 2304DJ31-5 TaxID=3386273 RepID=UPI0039BD1A8A